MDYVSLKFWRESEWYTVGDYTLATALEIVHDPKSYRLLDTTQFLVVSHQTGEIIIHTELQKGAIEELYCMVYFETIHGENIVIPHENLEDAAKFAEENNIEVVHMVGADWADYKRCSVCGRWHDTRAIENGKCEYCTKI